MRKRSVVIIVIWLASVAAFGQNGKMRKFDRRAWHDAVDEINRKRYDPIEKERSYESAEESEYYNSERSSDGNSSSGSNNTITDDGIYDGSSNNDDDFFGENNDRGDGSGKDGGELDPKFGDGDGSGNGNGNGTGRDNGSGRQYSNDRNNNPNAYTPPPKKDPSKPVSPDKSAGSDFTWLLFVLGGLLVALIVYMVLAANKTKNKKVAAVETDESKFENMTITKSELELALEAALKNKNYREAVRIYFIAVIKEMKDRNWIKWEKKKTNYHYINEIGGRAQQPDFITATRAFEVVWYGNRTMGENDYHQVEPLFKKLLASIHA